MNARRRVGLLAAVLGLATVTACAGSGIASPETSLTSTTGAPSSSTSSSTALTTSRVTAPPLSTSSAAATPSSSEIVETTEVVGQTITEASPPAAPSPPTTTTTADQPPAIAPEPAGDGSVSGRVVVIDPGHNGQNGANPSIINAPVDAGFGQTKACNTTGTSTNDGYAEHTFTWSVASNVKADLEAQGVVVVLTRESDDGVGPCVNVRARIGNENNADAVVSIHGDGSSEGDRGFYAMTSERAPNGSQMAARSSLLAGAVRDGLVADGLSPSNYVGSGGLWTRSDLAGLNLSMRPTTMVELGNMRDSQDSDLMKSAAGRSKMAEGISAGIVAFLHAG